MTDLSVHATAFHERLHGEFGRWGWRRRVHVDDRSANPRTVARQPKDARRSVNELLPALGVVLGVPLLLSGITAFARPRSRLDWLLSALLCAGVSCFMYSSGAVWSWIGFGWRIVPLAAAAVAVAWSARRLRARPNLPPARPFLPLAGTVFRGAMVALIAGMLIDLQMARLAPAGAVDLWFPLKGGRFAIMHGGGGAALNYHHPVPAQAYATDVVALNHRGRRARGVRPEALDAYEIFDRAVTSPCDGIVSGTSDGAPDAPIGRADPLKPAGNHVLLFCAVGRAGITLLLAHFRSGSVAVARGDRVRRGTLLGRVGNSGNSTEPHLHIHAVRGSETDPGAVLATAHAVPLTFNGRFLTRNDLIHVSDPR